jgi:hypothetical protein
MDVDPYKLFGFQKGQPFTIDELKAKFKQLAMVSHPDKGGSEELFLLVAKCFKLLMKEYERRTAQAQHHELKRAFEASTANSSAPEDAIPDASGKGFNLKKFNAVFETNRQQRTEDAGYQEWIERNAVPEVDDRPKKPLSKDDFNPDKFNKRFEKMTMKQASQDNKFVVKYREPEPLVMAKKIQFTELGVDKVDDFSADNTSRRALNFMDYKVAHTTSRIVDPRTAQRKEYRSIGELEVERDNISYVPSADDIEYWEQRKRQEAIAEQRRQEVQQKQDVEAFERYERMKMLMLGR